MTGAEWMTHVRTRAHADALRRRLGELGVATVEQLEQAQQEQRDSGHRYAAVLVRHGLLRQLESGTQLAAQLGWLPLPVDAAHVEGASVVALPWELCRTHRVVPLDVSTAERAVLATDDPLTLLSLEMLEQRCGTAVGLVLVPPRALEALLGRMSHQTSAPQPAARTETAAAEAGAGDEPLVRLVDSFLTQAVRTRASDVHLEPLSDRMRMRYRIDGVLHEVSSPPKALQGSIISRLKIMAGLNIAEKRLPQDGRLQVTVEQRALDVRISTLPALHGESVVMRLLDRSQPVRGLHELGLPAPLQQQWQALIARPYGMVLVTGPTGSGKTTTLYATLGMLNQPTKKLITVEDPVEYQLSGVNQTQVKPAIGLTFASGLRAMLRQAPDVILVGEIRDQETAQIAIQAALTGHLVFSTLHTNDAASAVTRLIDMGIAPFLVASTIQGVLAQRLVRQLCSACRQPRPPTPDERAFLEPPPMKELFGSAGCDRCRGSGYFGRLGVYELLAISESLRALIVAKSAAPRLQQQAAQEGMRTLRDDGRQKIRDGLTSMEEVLRATSEAERET